MNDAAADRTRTVEWQDPLATAARGRELSGLEFLEGIRSGTIPRPPIAALLGFELVAKTGRILCTAVAVHVGGRTATAEGRIVDEAGTLYATGTASCLVFDLPAPRA